jgi:hypothetical protein
MLTFKWLSLILSDGTRCDFVGEINVSDDDLVFHNQSLSFLLITSCNKQNAIHVKYAFFQSIINTI